MEYRKLGNLEVSAIGLGTLRTFDVTSEEDISVRQDIVDNCIASQVDLIDTAAWYGNAEQVVGETIAGKRDKFYLAFDGAGAVPPRCPSSLGFHKV